MKLIQHKGRHALCRRRGTTILECAVAYPLLMLLTVGVIILALGVFRYQQVARLAREGARWASVHGATYQSEQNQPAPTSATVLTNAVNPKVVGLNSSNLTCTLITQANTVSVTITYNWVPEGLFSNSITMSSTSTLPITY